MAQVVKTKKWLDLSDQYVVLLGAGSAMGPLLVLLALGANVIAIDICPKAFGMSSEDADYRRRGPWKGPLAGGRDGLIEACDKRRLETTCRQATFRELLLEVLDRHFIIRTHPERGSFKHETISEDVFESVRSWITKTGPGESLAPLYLRKSYLR